MEPSKVAVETVELLLLRVDQISSCHYLEIMASPTVLYLAVSLFSDVLEKCPMIFDSRVSLLLPSVSNQPALQAMVSS